MSSPHFANPHEEALLAVVSFIEEYGMTPSEAVHGGINVTE
ncbi:hypothetical protein [Halobellus rufus]|nr:hypothetical protein [Halobellus rufus]